MTTASSPMVNVITTFRSRFRADGHLVFVSLFILFLELACIRWFPAHVLFLTFFTNTVLLASFLGISLGCLGTKHKRSYFDWTPFLLAVAVIIALLVEVIRGHWGNIINAGNQEVSPPLVYFGTEHNEADLAGFIIPIELVEGVFFLLIALVFVGPGQELGRSFNRIPNRVSAYTLNILGSLVSIVLFAACSWWELTPFWWFLPVIITFGYWQFLRSKTKDLPIRWAILAAMLVAVSLSSDKDGVIRPTQYQNLWSPYYRIQYWPSNQYLEVNQIGHQMMLSRNHKTPEYSLPYFLNRDGGGRPFKNVLIIGAGSGNDVSHAIQWDVAHIDAVEIDPTIQRLGRENHPDRPYQDPRVTIYLDDGRNFLRSTKKQYDLIIYALVDSLVLHSSYSNIRLESYLDMRKIYAVQPRLALGSKPFSKPLGLILSCP
jgi:hypothetical protein